MARLAITAVACVAGVGGASAQDRQTKELVIYHRTRPDDIKKQWAPRLDFGSANEFSLRPGQRVYFAVVQAPLVFDYTATPLTATLTADAEAVRKVVESLKGFAEPPAGGTAQGQPAKKQVGPFVCPTPSKVGIIDSDGVTREICKLDSLALEEREKAFGDLVTDFKTVPDLIVKVAQGKDVRKEPAASSTAPKRVRLLVKAAMQVKAACNAMGQMSVMASLADENGTQKQVLLSCAPATPYEGTILAVVDNILSAAVEGENLAKVLDAFASDVAAEGPKELVDEKDDKKVARYVDYDVEHDQKMTVRIKRTKRYDKVLTEAQIADIEDAIEDQIGEYRFVFHPRNLARYRFAGGVVYSLVTRSTFETIKRGDDLYVQEKVTGSSNFGAAFMLNVIPVGLSDPSFEPYVQVGVGPKRDNVAFYAGIGMYGFNKFSIGLGVAVEKTDALINGVHAGDKIADPARLKDATYQRYKAGLYFQVSVKP